jgi:hypothetical protein
MWRLYLPNVIQKQRSLQKMSKPSLTRPDNYLHYCSVSLFSIQIFSRNFKDSSRCEACNYISSNDGIISKLFLKVANQSKEFLRCFVLHCNSMWFFTAFLNCFFGRTSTLSCFRWSVLFQSIIGTSIILKWEVRFALAWRQLFSEL